ncbi:MAG TPA: inositol monophosphatase [Chloroflexota bacterium]|nr:inositol monophosphatase [Chloroflexota bacterium]
MDLERWREVAESAVREGGEEIRRHFTIVGDATEKRGDDLVTPADLAAETRILQNLRRAEPSFGSISEEFGASGADREYVWVVDPLDGTNNFAIGSPYVGLGVTLSHQGIPIVAAVHEPFSGRVWTAMQGFGARCDGRTIQVNTVPVPARAVIAYVQGYPVSSDETLRIYVALLGKVKRVLSNWAPLLDWCLLAEGRIDAVISLDSEPEDQFGGALIAREAGAHLFDFQGKVAGPTAARLVAAGSTALRDHLLALLREVG